MENPFRSADNAVFFIAEIGGNHEGDFEYARRLNSLAIASGADAVKHQLYLGDTLVSSVESPDRNAHFKRFELGREEYLVLAEDCERAGVQFMASVWDVDILEWIDPHLRIHKVGSGDLTCYPMLRRLVATRKPIILSTGLATLDEVADAVRYIASLDETYLHDRKLALLQCTASYPCPDGDANLDAIITLREQFGLPVGYSDHTEGTAAIEAAVALGAEIVEAHFTDDREGKTFRDHKVSLTGSEVGELLTRLKRVRLFKGDGIKQPTPAEKAQDHVISFRRSVYAARNIAEGEEFSGANLTVLRPAVGVPASRYDAVIGRRAKRALRRFEAVKDEDLG